MSKFIRLGIVAMVSCLTADVALADKLPGKDIESAYAVMLGCRGFLAAEASNSAAAAATMGDAIDYGFCTGRVAAVFHLVGRKCAPPAVSLEQTVRIVVQYIDSQPNRLHEPFDDLAAEAFIKAWPCH